MPAAQAEGDAGAVSDGETAEEPEKSTIVVHVCGAVARPGVYELAAGSRAEAAVKAAGGLTGDALEESLNQARILTDGSRSGFSRKRKHRMRLRLGRKEFPAVRSTSTRRISPDWSR